jgi:hypothetical protein
MFCVPQIKGFHYLMFNVSDPRHIHWYMEKVGNVLHDH